MSLVEFDERVATVALSRVPGVGGATLRRLIARCGSALEVLNADDDSLLEVARVTPSTVTELRTAADRLDLLRDELCRLQEEGVEAITHAEFPPTLRAASDAPAVLYVRGRLTGDDDLAVAIVGSREASAAGLALASRLAAALAERGLTVVSGLAIGIDAAAHRGALEAGGRSLGVLGSGVRRPFPPENVELAEAMSHRGAVVSELEPDTPVNARQLMMRDRIISGLALAVIVVEARSDSGTMDTAERARRQGRARFAVDWPGDGEATAGNRRLLRAGATPVPIAAADLDLDALLVACAQVAAGFTAPPTDAPQPSLFD